LKSLPTSLCLLSAGKRYQREKKHFPLLTKGDEGGLDNIFQRAKVLQILKKLDGSLLGVL
jgi:hypothetical protein